MRDQLQSETATRLMQGGESWNSWQQQNVRYPLNISALAKAGMLDLARLHLEGCVLSGPVIFDGLHLPPNISFDGTQFTGHVSFVGCLFRQDVDFSGAIFRSGADFTRAKFRGKASFRRAQFTRECTFDSVRFYQHALFDQCSVTGNAELKIFRSVCSDLAFQSVAADGLVSFYRTRFRRAVSFDHSQFRDRLHLEHTQFRARASFRNATFTYARCSDARFISDADFSSSPSDARGFEIADYSRARFYGVARFQYRQFRGETIFRGAHFEKPPEFFNAKFPNEVDFEQTTFGAISKGDAWDAERAYRTLKLKMSELQNHRAEALFFAKEMRARGLREASPLLSLLHALYGAWSNYGQSIARPAFGLLGTALSCLVAYLVVIDGTLALSCVQHDVQCAFSVSRFAALTSLAIAGLVPFFDVAKRASALAWSCPYFSGHAVTLS